MRDGTWRANLLFKAGEVESLTYYFAIDGEPGRTFVHPITPAERQSGIVPLEETGQ